MILIPTGSFQMGCVSGRNCLNNEKPSHKVTVTAFKLAKTEVTFSQWDACVKAKGCSHNPNDEGWGRDHQPVINISWDDTQEYIRWLNKETGKTYRLPSEAEWEYAARAHTNTAYPWGNTVNRNHANYGKKMGKTTPVGNYPTNDFGLHDMHGNVWEWVADSWHKNYQGAPVDGQVWDDGSASRVLRGGSWDRNGGLVRSAVRYFSSPDSSSHRVGVRLAQD